MAYKMRMHGALFSQDSNLDTRFLLLPTNQLHVTPTPHAGPIENNLCIFFGFKYFIYTSYRNNTGIMPNKL